MALSDLKIFVIGQELYPDFCALDVPHTELVCLENTEEIRTLKIEQGLVFTTTQYQQEVALIFNPETTFGQLFLFLVCKQNVSAHKRRVALNQGYFEVFSSKQSRSDWLQVIKKYSNLLELSAKPDPVLHFHQQLLDASPAAVRIVDFNKKIRYTNTNYDKLNLSVKEKIIGSSCNLYFCAMYCNTGQCAINKMIKQNQSFTFEHSAYDSSGNQKHYLFDIKPFKNEAGETVGIIESILDISQIKQNEFALQKSEDRFKMYIENSPLAIFICDANFNVNYLNKAIQQLVYPHPENKKPLHITDLILKSEPVLSAIKTLVEHEKFSAEVELKTPLNQNIPVILEILALNNQSYLAFCTDIRSLKKTEAELNAYKSRLEFLVNQRTQELKIQEEKLKINYKVAHEGIWDYNIVTKKMFFSPTLFTMLGFEPYEFEQNFHSLEALMHPSDVKFSTKIIRDFTSNNEDSFSLDFRLKTKAGPYKWIRSFGIALNKNKRGEKTRIVGTHIDIHVEKRAQLQLIKSEIKYKKLVEQINDWIWEINEHGVYEYCSPHVYSILGYRPEEIMGQSVFNFMGARDAKSLRHRLSSYIANSQAFSGIIIKNYRKNGRVVYLETSGKPVFNNSGAFAGYMGIHRDVSERIKIEKEIVDNEEQFRKIFNTTADLILITNKKGLVLNMNRSTEKLFKITNYKPGSTFLGNLFTDTKLKLYLASFNARHLNVTEIEYPSETKNLIFELNGSTIPYKGKKAVLNVFKNITSRKELERKVLQTVIETEEKERARFAKDLHDGLGPQLSAIRLYVNSLGLTAYNPEKKTLMIENAKKIIDNAITSTKEIANNLMPSVLENFGLVQAIQLFCDDVSAIHHLRITIRETNFNKNLSKNMQIALFRVISELINNTIKHANAKNIQIEFNSNLDSNWVVFTDDGRGFDLKNGLPSGNGLENIKSRIKSINGHVHIETEPNKGLKVLMRV